MPDRKRMRNIALVTTIIIFGLCSIPCLVGWAALTFFAAMSLIKNFQSNFTSVEGTLIVLAIPVGWVAWGALFQLLRRFRSPGLLAVPKWVFPGLTAGMLVDAGFLADALKSGAQYGLIAGFLFGSPTLLAIVCVMRLRNGSAAILQGHRAT